MRFDVTRDNERLLTLLKRLNKVPQHLQHLSGFNVSEVLYEDGTPDVCLILGAMNANSDGRRPQAIPLASDPAMRPHIKSGGRIYRADVVPDGDSYQLVKPQKDDTALRIITTGLLVSPDGSTTRDWLNLVTAKAKPRYHGVFPITADAAEIIGEGIDGPITASSKVIFDERFGKIKNMPGVPKSREVTIEGVLGGPVLVGQIDGVLKIHELTTSGWKVHDVTNSAHWQQKFMDLASKDPDYLAAVRKDQQRKSRRTIKQVVKAPPSDHPDA